MQLSTLSLTSDSNTTMIKWSLMQLRSLHEADIKKDTRVFVRADIDVPFETNVIIETFRLDRAVPTLKYIIEKGGMPIIAGHTDASLESLTNYFDKNLGANTYQILENLRQDPREKENSLEFAKELIQKTNCAIYINESFATSHREHTSIMQIPSLIPAFAGLNLLNEIAILEKALNNPEKPCIAIVGGAKIESKLPTISNLSKKTDAVLIGGKLGFEISTVDSPNIKLPDDYVDNKDIGPITISNYKRLLSNVKTVIWAGPLGMWEESKYLAGTDQIAEQIIEANAYTIIGGGDTIAALRKCNKLDKIGFVSTGGGAMLQFLAKETLPGLLPLMKL